MFNPLRSVDGKAVKAPDSFVPTVSDISASDAGNSEDGTMWKKRLGQKLQFAITYTNITRTDAASVLQAFAPEYIYCEILDPAYGDIKNIEFYVGDRTFGTFNAVTDRWESLTFNIIQRRIL